MKRVYKTLGVLLAMSLGVACNDNLRTESDFLDKAPDGSRLEEDNNPYWDWVGTFPGWIDVDLERVDYTPVVVDGCYTKVSRDSRIGFAETPWVSTGYYAAPGEWITLVKPARLRSAVSWRIGEWKCELKGVATLQRYSKVYETGKFTADTMRVRSWFGGHIYILPDEPFAQPETFILKGGIKSPDFIAGQTDAGSWREAIKEAKLPYAELVGKHTVWTLPLETLQKITDPEGLLSLYDDFIENDFWAIHGLSKDGLGVNKAPDFPVRIVQDLQLCNGSASHSGYPIVIDKSEATLGTDVDGMRSTSVAWNFFKELGHDYQTWCWSWGAVKEVVNMLPYYHARARVLGQWPTVRNEKNEPDRGVLKWKEYIIPEYVKVENASKDFDESSSDLGKVINSQNGRMMPFIQLAQKYGWGLYAYLGKYSRNMLENENAKMLKILNTNGRRDFFCKRVCEYAGANLMPFFDAWGIKYSNAAAQDMQQYPDYVGVKFWENWEVTHMPEENSGDFVPSIQLADDNYNSVSNIVDQTLWVADSASPSTSDPQNVCNGIVTTGSGEENNKAYWFSESVSRPNYNKDLWVCVDMRRQYILTEFGIKFRSHTGRWGWAPEKLSIQLKNNPEEEWGEPIELTTGKVRVMQYIALPSEQTARYMKVNFLQGFSEGNSTGAVFIDEIGAIARPAKVDDVTEDNDFPEWK